MSVQTHIIYAVKTLKDFKAIVHPKIKIHSISTHSCADVRMSEENSVAAKSSTIEVNGDQF